MKSVLILFDNVVSLYIWILIIHVIFSWLVAFNVLNTSNRFVYSVLDFSYKLTAPPLNFIRRFDKSLATIPNFQFAEKAVINNSLITNRRINWIIGLEYRTTSKQLIDIKQQIENYIKNSELFSKSENTMLSVKIDQFAASSIDIKLICFTKTTKYLEWMKVKDLLALEIKNIVEKNNASFAFPSTSVYVEKN